MELKNRRDYRAWIVDCHAVIAMAFHWNFTNASMGYIMTAGQKAYELELTVWPYYHDKQPRKTWDQLCDIAKQSWELNPTPRRMNHA